MMIKVISRESPLAIIQVEEIFSKMPDKIEYELKRCSSFGDKHKSVSLMDTICSDFFTKELDAAILNGEADVAIHSAKDLPYPMPSGLSVIALSDAFDNSDSLVLRQGMDYQLNTLPSGAVVATSSPRRREELMNYRPDLKVKSIRGTIEERIMQVDKGDYDALIVATCALQRLNLTNRIVQILPFKTHPLQGALAVVAKSDREDLKHLFSSIDVQKNFGKVTLVGFGPGNYELLTIAAEKRLKSADCIIYDDLIDHNYLKHFTAELMYVGKRKNNHSKEQCDINQLLLDTAIKGKNVVRLKGGDPMIFAHGGEEIEYLESNLIDVDVIPGITTANAFSAYTKIPLTFRDISSSVAFITGHNISTMTIPNTDTIVFYMAGSKIKEIATMMIKRGFKAQLPVMLVYHVSFPDQKEFIYTLKELSEMEICFPTPVIIVVGDVVSLKSSSSQMICSNKNILVTGLDATPYQSLGKVIHTPLIEISPVDEGEMRKSIAELGDYKYLLFTSKNAVRSFFEVMKRMKKDLRSLNTLSIVSIGDTTTNELSKYGIYPNIQSAEDNSQGVIETFKKYCEPAKVLIPRSDIALSIIPAGLCELGFEVTTLTAYQNRLPENVPIIDLSTISTIVFTSPSCVDNFLLTYKVIPQDKIFVARGMTTYNHLLKLDFPINKITIFDEKL